MLLVVKVQDFADTHTLKSLAKDVELLQVGGNYDVLAKFGANYNAFSSQVELYRDCIVLLIVEVNLQLEQ